jgi:hypothetical protein
LKCDHCGENLRGRVDLFNDLSIQYADGNKVKNYYCRKVIIGSSGCYKPIEVKLTFDKNKKILEKEISGGEFITKEAYEESIVD